MILNLINTYAKRIMAYITIGIVLFVYIGATAAIYIQTFNHNEEMSEKIQSMGYMAFDRVNDLLNTAEEIISSNREFFTSEEYKDNFSIVSQISSLKNNCQYIEKIVFYRNNSQQLITDTGTIKKNEFFEYEFKNDSNNVAFWDNIMNTYRTPTIVPVSNYVVTSGGQSDIRRFFVIPKIYRTFDVGVLFFINEEKFLQYCSFNAEQGYKISFYDAAGNWIFGNSEKHDVEIADLKKGVIRKIGFTGKYERINRFNYEDMIIRTATNNGFVGVLALAAFLGMIIMIAFFIKIKGNSHANMVKFAENGIDISTLLYACMNDGELHEANKEILRQSIIRNDDSGFVLCAAVFKNAANKRKIPNAKMANNKLPKSVLAINRLGGTLILLANIPPANMENAQEYVESKCAQFKEAYSNVADIKLILGKVFNEIDDIKDAYTEFVKILLIHENGLQDADMPMMTQEFKRNLQKYISEGNFEGMIEAVRGELLNTVEKNISYEMLKLYIIHIYFSISEMLAQGDNFIKDTYEILLEWMKSNEYFFNNDAAIKILLNILMDAEQYSIVRQESALKIANVLKYIDNNYKQNIGLSEVAENFGMKPKNFSAFFKRHVNIGYVEYLSQLKIKEAKRLMTETDMSIGEIYEELGYLSGSTFTMTFKKYTGVSPMEYKKSLNNR